MLDILIGFATMTYRFLHSSGGNLGLLSILPQEHLGDYFIIRDENKNLYTVYKRTKLRELFDLLALARLPDAPSLHEVILPQLPQKIRLDIDIGAISEAFERLEISKSYLARLAQYDSGRPKCPKCGAAVDMRVPICCGAAIPPTLPLSTADKKASVILYSVIAAYKKVIALYSSDLNYVLCESNGSLKYSYHLISTAYAPDSTLAREVAVKIHAALGDEIKPFNDVGVTSIGTHNLRLCLAVKGTRQKTIMKHLFDNELYVPARGESRPQITYENWLTTLVTHIGITDHPLDFYKNPVAKPKDLPAPGPTAEMTPEMKIKVGQLFGGLIEHVATESRISYRRVTPGHCALCERTHDKDNTLYVIRGADGRFMARCYKSTGHIIL